MKRALFALLLVACDPQRASWGFGIVESMQTPADDPSLACGVTIPQDALASQRSSCAFTAGAHASATLGVDAKPEELMPFFIEWGKGTVHPSVDAPSGCRLENFSAGDTDPAALTKTFRKLGLDVPVYRATKPELRARIIGPKGTLEVNS